MNMYPTDTFLLMKRDGNEGHFQNKKRFEQVGEIR